MKRLTVVALLVCWPLFCTVSLFTQANSTPIPAARQARDQGDVPALRQIIRASLDEARRKHAPEAYQQVALLDLWLCEAGYVAGDLTSATGVTIDDIVWNFFAAHPKP